MPVKIKTTRFGTFNINEEDIIFFPKGIPGFETHTQWALTGEDEDPVKWLQSLRDGGIALPVVIPQAVMTDYNARLPESELSVLETNDIEDLALLVVLSIPSNAPWNMTANLRAPLVINRKKRIASQVITENEEYGVRAFVLSDEMRENMSQKAAASFETSKNAAPGA